MLPFEFNLRCKLLIVYGCWILLFVFFLLVYYVDPFLIGGRAYARLLGRCMFLLVVLLLRTYFEFAIFI